MILFRLTGFFFLVMASFSFGAVAGNRPVSMTPESPPSPGFVDIATIFLSWLAALAAYFSGYRIASAATLAAGTGLLAGFILHRFLKQGARDKPEVGIPGSKNVATGLESSPPSTPQPRGHFLPSWRLFARLVGGFQSRLLLTAFYFIVMMPFGILVGNLGDPLGLKVTPRESFWRGREDDSQSLEGARRQS